MASTPAADAPNLNWRNAIAAQRLSADRRVSVFDLGRCGVSPQMGWAECRAATAAQGKAFPSRPAFRQNQSLKPNDECRMVSCSCEPRRMHVPSFD